MNVLGTDGPPRKVRILALMCVGFVMQAQVMTPLFLISRTLSHSKKTNRVPNMLLDLSFQKLRAHLEKKKKKNPEYDSYNSYGILFLLYDSEIEFP